MTLAELRKNLGLSQRELNRRANLPGGIVRQIEEGITQNPSVGVCMAIVTALRESGAPGANVEELFGASVDRAVQS